MALNHHKFSGYDPSIEEREELFEACLDFDIQDLVVQGELPDTRGIMNLMRRDDQYQQNSCSGFGLTHAVEVGLFTRTKKWRQFNPNFSYVEGQKVSGISGDRGATIHGVVTAAENKGCLPEDVGNDGTIEYPYSRTYINRFPSEAYEEASKWRIGYRTRLKGFDAILRFLQTGQGGVVCGSSWGNYRPTTSGILSSFRGGGGGHATAYIDWITINGRVYLVKVNSHGSRWGKNGFAFCTKGFVDAQARDRWTVTIGVSDLSSPEPREIDFSTKWMV